MACEACHIAKVKCDKGSPSCARCLRLNLQCVPHVSLQGRGTKRRRKKLPGAPMGTENDFVQNLNPEKKLHFGVNHFIRQWIYLSFARRSFRLLEMACRFSNKLGIDMDQILSGSNLPEAWFSSQKCTRRMQVPDNFMTLPASDQDVGGGPLPVSDIPPMIWTTMRCVPSVDTPTASNDLNLGSRWMFFRETKLATTRFFVSDAFAKDVAPLSIIEKTWKENKIDVARLWHVATTKNDKGENPSFIHQISRYDTPGVSWSPSRSKDKRIKLASGEIVAVDIIFLYVVVHLDHALVVLEFIPTARTNPSPQKQKEPQENHASSLENSALLRDEMALFDDLPDVDVLVGDETWLSDIFQAVK